MESHKRSRCNQGRIQQQRFRHCRVCGAMSTLDTQSVLSLIHTKRKPEIKEKIDHHQSLHTQTLFVFFTNTTPSSFVISPANSLTHSFNSLFSFLRFQRGQQSPVRGSCPEDISNFATEIITLDGG